MFEIKIFAAFAKLEINYFAIFIASFVSFAIGTFWYSRALFGKYWLQYINKTEEEVQHKALKYYGVAYLAVVVTCFILAYFVEYMRARTMGEGILTGLILWFGFSAPTSAFSYMLEHRSVKLLLIHSGYFLAMFIVSSTLLAMWK